MSKMYFPYEDAKTVPLGALENAVFTNAGSIKKEAEYAVKRFCASYGLPYADFWNMVQKNHDFYWEEYRLNNPDATNAEILSAQKASFVNSTRNRIAKEYSARYIAGLDEWVWLPSSSEHPRDRHEERYGNTYTKSSPPPTLPAEEPNCECGIGVP